MTSRVELTRDVKDVTDSVVALRRDLHRHPELAFDEVRTAATLAARLEGLGLRVEQGIGGTGVLAILEGGRAGRMLLLRADMDALPLQETTGRDYASAIPGRCHACGHDVHSAVVAGVAQVLARHRERIAGRVAFVFQPADEPMRGARRMIDDGLLARVRPDVTLGLHVLPMARTGQVVAQAGPLWASWDALTLHIAGPPPAPDAPGDVARLAARLTTALYELVEREGRSSESVTFRVRELQAEQPGPGDASAAGIAVHLGRGDAGRASVELNLAMYDNALRARLLRRIESVADALVRGAGGTLSVVADYALPAVINDGHVAGALERASREVLGPDGLLTGWRHRFADDFSLFLDAAPGSLLLLGTASPEKGITEIWHRPGFDVDEDALPIGVHILSLAALDLLG